MASSRLNEPTIGIDPPLPTSAAGLPHSASSARRARRNAWFLVGSEMAGLPAWLMNSAFTSGGSRDVTKDRNDWATRSGFCLPTSRNEILALALAGNTVFVPCARVAADNSIDVAGRPRPELFERRAVALARRRRQPDVAQERHGVEIELVPLIQTSCGGSSTPS